MDKKCRSCHEKLTGYNWHQGRKLRRDYICIPCSKKKWKEHGAKWAKENPAAYHKLHRKSHLNHRYGISIEEYDKLFLAQGGVCALCSEPPTVRYLSVDHCHRTGTVRGLLCKKCNTALGLFRENIKTLRAAAEYVEKYNRGAETTEAHQQPRPADLS